MIQATRRLQFCTGHRLLGHEGPCRFVHGHNYVVLLSAQAAEPTPAEAKHAGLDSVGRVVDFAVLKERLGGWIDKYWDHQFLVNKIDSSMIAFLEAEAQPYFVFPINPTAEAMAQYLLDVVGPMVLGDTGVRLVRVELWETENCHAVASLE